MPLLGVLLVVWSASLSPAATPDLQGDVRPRLSSRLTTAEVMARVRAKYGNKEPKYAILPIQFTLSIRAMEAEMLGAVVPRIAAEASDTAASNAPGYAVGDYGREFSPHPTFRVAEGKADTDLLVCSYHGFHGQVTSAIRETAFTAVLKEIGAEDLLNK